MKALCIPPSKQYPGLSVYCNKCKANITSQCKQNQKPISKCSDPDKHKFKFTFHIPSTTNDRITRILNTRNLDKAIQEAIIIKNEFRLLTHDELKNAKTETIKASPKLLLDAQARYLGYMSGDSEIVSHFFHRERSKEYLSDIERGFDCFNKSLEAQNTAASLLPLRSINARIIGNFCRHMEDKGLTNRTFNKYLGYLTGFFNWLIQVEGHQLTNYFQFVRRKPATVQDIATISIKEYFSLLELIDDKGLGIQVLSTGEVKNLWKPWLKNAVRLGLLTGRRAEELFHMKFSDIIEVDGEPAFIKSEDIKVNNMFKRADGNKKYVFVPVNADLKELLLEFGYNKFRGQAIGLIANDDKMQTKTKCRFVWRAFAHYYKQLNTGRKITFKALRKTYITKLTKKVGIERARIITGHSGYGVMQGHYIEPTEVSSVAMDFSIFA